MSPEQSTGPDRESPEIRLSFQELETVLTWGNTLLRYFDEGGGMYDHVAHKMADGTYIAFKPKEELQEALTDGKFPRRHDPIVDEATIQWYMESLHNNLDEIMGTDQPPAA